jgi:triacylglycerol lipase
MKSQNIVFVHGIFGWGPTELDGLPYWGYALKVAPPRFKVHEGSCGPVSSFHDRACEVAAQIKGTKTDYGEQHSTDAKHARFSDDYSNKAFVQNWSEENPVILVGHSAGAHTCLRLQRLLAEDYWGWGSNASWVEAVVSVSGVLNGSTLPYMLGCDKITGRLTGPLGDFIGNGLQIFAMAAVGNIAKIYDFDLDQWIGQGHQGDLTDICEALAKSDFAKGEDNLGFDLTLQGGLKANKASKTEPGTYYLSIVTEQTTKGWFTPHHFPDLLMNPVLAAASAYQGLVVDFDVPPIPGWGFGDLHINRWRENDGAVSSISQRYPFTGGNHPVGGEPIFDRQAIAKGQWYFENAEKSTGRSFDHLDIGIGCLSDPTIVEAHKTLYRNIYSLLGRLP